MRHPKPVRNTNCSCVAQKQAASADARVVALTSQEIAVRRGSDAVGANNNAAVVRAAMEAQRQRLVVLRANGTIGDAAFQCVEEALDWTELGWAQVVRSS